MQTTTKLTAILAPARPVPNRIVHIKVEGIRGLDGSKLNGPIEFYFTTPMTPLYSNAMRVRLIAGEFLSDVPDDTLNQLVHYYSIQADLLNYSPDVAAINRAAYDNYRARWVTASAIVGLLAGTSVNSELQKRLGDLSVKRSRAAQELLDKLRAELQELTAILQNGGDYGIRPGTAVKGSDHPDTPLLGRLWPDPSVYITEGIPGANKKRQYMRADGLFQRRLKKTWGY